MSAPNGRNSSRWLLAFKENIFLNSSFFWERYFNVFVDERIRFFYRIVAGTQNVVLDVIWRQTFGKC